MIEKSQYYQHVSRKIPLNVCCKAIEALFPSITIEPNKKQELVKFISEQFAVLDCCVLYRINKSFKRLCESLGLDPGDREVVIREDFSVFCSRNFNVSPLNVRNVRSV